MHVVELSQSCWREAWALRRLEEQGVLTNAGELDNTSRWLVEVMVREHSEALENHLTLLESKVRPVFRGGEEDGPETVTVKAGMRPADVLEVVAAADALIHRLFTIPSKTANTAERDEIPPGEAIKRLLARLPEARAAAGSLRMEVAIARPKR
jgi:hypothetical protein